MSVTFNQPTDDTNARTECIVPLPRLEPLFMVQPSPKLLGTYELKARSFLSMIFLEQSLVVSHASNAQAWIASGLRPLSCQILVFFLFWTLGSALALEPGQIGPDQVPILAREVLFLPI